MIIGWLISVFIWLIFFILMIVMDRKDNLEWAMTFNIYQLCMLIPIWFFVIAMWVSK